MRSLLIACSLLFSAHAFTATTESNESIQSIEIGQDKAVERHYYNFGMQRIGSLNLVTFRVTNTGSTPLTFQSARISGIGYSATHNCGGVLAPQEVCSFRIQYFPPFEGYHTGRFILSFNQGSDIVVDLSGQAVR